MKRFKYHFEPKHGWINDPNGLIYFKGKYHAFFQYNPNEPKWGPMHWGHAVSDDLIHWQELPIALKPDMYYENDGGCFSGSAVEKDGIMYLFYTSVSDKYGQTQSVAMSDDGINFRKYEGNPVIINPPCVGSKDFRDPKVTFIDGKYYMVVGSGKDGVGKVLLYKSDDLLKWNYIGVLYENAEFGEVFECPDFFKLGESYVLMFSKMISDMNKTQFVIGDFDGEKFYPKSFQSPENGPEFYAPQTFQDNKGRRILIGWFYNWGKEPDPDLSFAGALTIPREVKIDNGKIHLFPVSEAYYLLNNEDELVEIQKNKIVMHDAEKSNDLCYNGIVKSVHILRDEKALEVFINNGETSYSYWI
ncbi:MAG: glycoside hydrolase family 32 protein [Clostridium sp.]|nr:glycoside hydrolase family 32 protein [Clostridium sp.]